MTLIFRNAYRCSLLSALFVALSVAIPTAFAATLTVNPGDNLAQVIVDAASGDTILVNPGSYTGATTTADPFNSHFWVNKPLTIKAADAANPPNLSVASGTSFVVIISSNDVTIDGFNVSGGNYGVFVKDFLNANGGTLSNIKVKNINATASTSNAGHGISFENVNNSIIDSNTIVTAHDNGIYVTGSSDILVMDNTVQSTIEQHGIGVTFSSRIEVINNTINGSGFHGILFVDTDYSRIVDNTVIGHKYDGIDLSDGSNFNYVGNNDIPAQGLTLGTGIGTGTWFNNESNWNFAFANSMSGSPENGFSVWVSSYNYLLGNVISNNFEGGILVWNAVGANTNSVGDTPDNNVIHNNYIFDNHHNGQVHIKGSNNTNIAYNYLSGTNSGTDAGAKFGHNADSTANVVGVQFYENIMKDFVGGPTFWENVSQAFFYRNRLFNVTNKWAYLPSGVAFDAGATLGGNFWSDHAATGNPSQGTPYSQIIYDAIGNRGIYVDQYPFQSEHLLADGQYKILLREPYSAQVLAAGRTKTIRWESRGCVNVSISYSSASTGHQASIVANYPDVGFYRWSVPSSAIADDYVVTIACIDSSGTSHASSQSAAFSIKNADLLLISPGRFDRKSSASNLTVVWKKSSSISSVDVYTRVNPNQQWELAQSNVTGTSAIVALNDSTSNSYSVMVKSGDSAGDSVDGMFSVRGTTGHIISPSLGTLLDVGKRQELSWNCPSNSYSVDIYKGDGTNWTPMVAGLPDFGRYTLLVPEGWTSDTQILILCKDSSGAGVAQLNQTNNCATTDAGLNVHLPCANVDGIFYQAELNRYEHPTDTSNIFWRLGVASIAADNGYCTEVDTSLNILFSCVQVNGTQYQAILYRFDNSLEPTSLFWSFGSAQE